MSPVFEPPVVFETPAVNAETPRAARALLRHYGPFARGRTVLWDGATFVLVDTPTQDQLDGLVDGETYFVGGHVYEVPDTAATALTAAGFGTYLSAAPEDLSGTWATAEGFFWGELAGYAWGGTP